MDKRGLFSLLFILDVDLADGIGRLTVICRGSYLYLVKVYTSRCLSLHIGEQHIKSRFMQVKSNHTIEINCHCDSIIDFLANFLSANLSCQKL